MHIFCQQCSFCYFSLRYSRISHTVNQANTHTLHPLSFFSFFFSGALHVLLKAEVSCSLWSVTGAIGAGSPPALGGDICQKARKEISGKVERNAYILSFLSSLLPAERQTGVQHAGGGERASPNQPCVSGKSHSVDRCSSHPVPPSPWRSRLTAPPSRPLDCIQPRQQRQPAQSVREPEPIERTRLTGPICTPLKTWC